MRISVCAVNLVARRFLLISLSSASLLVPPVRGDENYFGYSYGSETLPGGEPLVIVFFSMDTAPVAR
jgi:hypothetical protein